MLLPRGRVAATVTSREPSGAGEACASSAALPSADSRWELWMVWLEVQSLAEQLTCMLQVQREAHKKQSHFLATT